MNINNIYISPFAQEVPDLPAISGVKLASTHTGMKYQNRDDVMLITLDEGTQAAAVFTKNSLCGEPIKWCRKILADGNKTARAIIVNAGVANVFTGKQGAQIVENTAAKIANEIGCDIGEVYIASTGVIGEQLDEKKLLKAIPELISKLNDSSWTDAAKAFMTVDTYPKAIAKTAFIGACEVKINGIIKGSGMINPNMATMIGYAFTDAKIPANVLQKWLNEDNLISYSSMTTEGDTSTSDIIMNFATCKKDHWEIITGDEEFLADLRAKFTEIHVEMAKMVAKDGEGASKYIEVHIKGAESDESARVIGLSIANSPLVKTAIAGEDANWGRIVMAIGKTDEKVNADKIAIWIGDELIAENGCKHADYSEDRANLHMKGLEISITVDVGVGSGVATCFTCDLTHEFITINADYRT